MRNGLRGVAVSVAVISALGLGTVPSSGATLDLHRGSRGTHVKTLEVRLHKLHLLHRADVDRRYWAATTRAVKRFQRQHHRRMTGRVNQRTWNLVARAVRKQAAAKPPAPKPPAPTILGHRGARVSGITENTLASMRYAARTADILEFDLQLTSDGEFVLMHDDTLDRTTDCTGRVAVRTAAYLRQHCTTDHGSGPVPTFAEVAAFAAQADKRIAPEIKDNSLTDDEVARFVAVIHDHGLTARTFVQSFHPEVFPRVKALEGALTFVYLTDPSTPPAKVAASVATIAGLNRSGLDARTVASFQKAGLRVWAWTAMTSADLSSLWKMRVSGVFTDIPATARKMYHP